MLFGPEGGTGGGHLGIPAPELGGAPSRRPVALRIGVELLRIGERVLEIRSRGIDVVDVDETVEQDPSVFPPRRDLVVAGDSPSHCRLPICLAEFAPRTVRRRVTLDLMADKSPKKSNSKKAGKSLKEKRADKQAKRDDKRPGISG